MAFRKVKDIAVIVGSYEDGQGVTKNRYANVGVVMKGDDGNSFILMSRYFNPAGVPFKPGDDKIVLSLFDPRDDNASATRPAATAPAASYAAASQSARAPAANSARAPVDDDVPF
jgi:hypothetical protein